VWSLWSPAVLVAMPGSHLLLLLLAHLVHGDPALEIVEVLPSTSNTESPLSNRLNTSKTTPLRLGQPYTLGCHVGDHVEIESCSWQFGFGPRISAPKNSTGEQQPKEGTISQSSKSCNLTLHSLGPEHMGTWSCRISHSLSNQWQEARIEVAEKIRDINVRLPTNIHPELYEVHLIPFIVEDNFTIAGQVEIKLNVSEPSDNITLHIYDIIIHEKDVTVQTDTGEMLEIVGHSYDEERQFYIVNLAQAPTSPTLLLNIFFTGNLNDELAGFYRSSYTKTSTGEKTYIATTQFEATDARRAFPCFDEPAMKAIFRVNLGRLPNMVSLSNMPIDKQGVPIPGSEYVWDEYQSTLKMSTYLLAFVVSDFVFRKSEPTDNGVEFRIWSREGGYDQTEWASQIGPQILAYYEDYFNTSFPLPKQDMIAIPDFSAGAMENWGLITYREVAILYEEGKSSRSDKEYVAIVVAHELAHQWFGDLVTMEWWTDLWLNEGFASYTEYIGTNHVSPETGILDRFVLESVQPALGYDALTSSHPISIPVNHPNEISEIFDTISYLKGGSVIRMMANFLGVSTFNRGIANYLHAYSLSNANQDNLWSFLTAVGQEDGTLVGKTVKEVMDTWTVQMGYPVVTINRRYDGSKSATAKQERFLLNPSDRQNSSDEHEYKWWVPLSFTTVANGFDKTSPNLWMSPAQAGQLQEFPLDGVEDGVALIANVQQTGFFRVNYDATNWHLIADLLVANHASVHRINRAQILNDAFELARAGLLEYPTALATTEYLGREEDYIPWEAALTGFEYLENMMKRTSGWGRLQSYMIAELQPLYDRLGFEERPDEPFLDEKLRIKMLAALCRLGHNECSQSSSNLLEEWMSMPNPDLENPIPTSLRSTVLCTGVARGGAAHWDFLWQRYLASNNANEKNNILGALSCTGEVWLLQKYLDMSINESSGVRKQDGYRVIVGVSKNIVGRYIAWDWIRANWAQLSAYYDTAISSSIGRILTAVASDFNTDFNLRQLEAFIAEHESELGTARRDAEVMVQGTKANIGWMTEHYNTILAWLPQKGQQPGPGRQPKIAKA